MNCVERSASTRTNARRTDRGGMFWDGFCMKWCCGMILMKCIGSIR